MGISRGSVCTVVRVVGGMLITPRRICHGWSGLVISGLGRCGGSGGCGCGCGSSSSVGRWASILVGPLIGLRGRVGWGWHSGLFGDS